MFLVTRYEFVISSPFQSEILRAVTRDGRAVFYAVYVSFLIVVNDYCTSKIHIQMQGKYPSIKQLFLVEKCYCNYIDSRIKSHHQADKLLKKCYHIEHFISSTRCMCSNVLA